MAAIEDAAAHPIPIKGDVSLNLHVVATSDLIG